MFGCGIARANTLVWTGGGLPANGKWSNSANWGTLGFPGNGDTVIFQGTVGLNNTNDLTGLTLNQIRFISTGFNLYGNPFTLTNSIVATNFTGTALINNSMTIATADVTMLVSNSIVLTLNNNFTGSVGVIKAGQGALLYQGLGNNTYTGTTLVAGGQLEFNVDGTNAFQGPLVIGDGTGLNHPTVVDLQELEFPTSVPIIINTNGTLSLNNNDDTIGTNLLMSWGVIETGIGTLTLSPNCTLTLTNLNNNSYIYGNLNIGSGTLTIQGDGFLWLFAVVSGSANIVEYSGLSNGSASGHLSSTLWEFANTYMGNFTANNCLIALANSQALGNPSNQMVLNGNSGVQLVGNINITNQSLTVYSTNFDFGGYTLQSASAGNTGATNSWTANFVLGTNCVIDVATNCAFTLNISNSIYGPGGLTKTGPGSLALAGPGNVSAYTGDTVVNSGILFLDSVNIIRYGALRIGDGVGGPQADIVRYLMNSCIYGGPGGSIVVITNSGLLDLNGFTDDVGPIYMDGAAINTGAGQLELFPPLATLNTTNGISYINGKLSLSTAQVNIFAVTNGLVISAAISDPDGDSFIKTGAGYMYLSFSNTYSGPTIIQEGAIVAENPLALGGTSSGVVVSNGASLELSGGIGITNKALTLNGLGVGGIGGYGSLDVESGVGTWAGPITNNAYSSLDSFFPGSALHINGPISGAGSLELFNQGTGGGTIFFDGSAANTYAGLTTVDAGCTLVLNKQFGIAAIAGNADVFGTLRLAQSVNMPVSAGVTVESGGLFDLSTSYVLIDKLNGTGTVNFGSAGFIQVGGNNGTSEFDGPFTGIGFPSGYTVAKNGGGTFTIGGNSTYTVGITHVYGGTLVVNGAQPLIPVTVESGATLGGTGTVGPITANGTIAPGDGPGILNSSNVTFSATGNFSVQLTGPSPGAGGYDQLNVTGTNTLANATLTVVPVFTTPVAVGQQFVILNNDLTDPVVGTFNGLPEGSTFTAGNYKFSISYVGGTGNDVLLTLKTVPGAAVSSAVTAGDGNHAIDPNGCNNLSLVVSNSTGSAMTGVTATLSTTTEGVVITQPYAPYGNLPANGTGTNLEPFQISALPGFVCGTPINLQLSVLSSLGAFTMNYVLQSGETAAVPSRYDVTGNVAIPDIGAVDSTNVVSGFNPTPLDKVVVSLFITHPFDSDLTNISLISPDGTTVLLSAANGGGGQNYGSGLSPDSDRTTFDDAAAASITNGSAPFVGSYRPQTPLSAFIDNATPNGNWHLHIADGFGGSLGTLRGWSLFLYGNTCGTGSGACDYCLTSISSVVTNTDATQSDRISRTGSPASCGALKAWPGYFGDAIARHYDIHAFTNTSASEACVTAVLNSSGDLQAAIYQNSFNPLNLSTNYLADSGNSTLGNINAPQSCSASIPPGGTFYVTVNEVTPNTGGQYTLQLSGLPCPPATLNIQPVSTNQARIYWDTSAGGYLLQSVSNLTAGAWAAVTNEPIVTSHNYTVTNSTALPATNRFYRLQHP